MTKNKATKINYKILGSKELADSEVEIECEIRAEEIENFRAKAIAKIQKDLSLPGFRPGHVPESTLIKHVGDLFIYNEMAEMTINEAFADIILESKTNFISMPNIQLTKIANNSSVSFKIIGPVMPEIKLPNYKKIAKEEGKEKSEPTEATDKELEETIEEIRKNHALRNHEHKEGDDHSNLPLPELDDEFVKKLGPDFKTVKDFKNKIKEGIQKEKEFKAKDKKRLAIIEKIIAETKLTLPKILVESELRKMQAQFEDDISRAGLKVDDYLKHLKKTKEDLNKEWAPDAEKRAKLQLVITKIALEEKLEADPEQVKKDVENLLKVYKDATEDRTRAYVEMMLTNEKVFEWLETQE
jgi:FKBP-type peptidyl-prolyl cis-trans isomerase (trigger factor)